MCELVSPSYSCLAALLPQTIIYLPINYTIDHRALNWTQVMSKTLSEYIDASTGLFFTWAETSLGLLSPLQLVWQTTVMMHKSNHTAGRHTAMESNTWGWFVSIGKINVNSLLQKICLTLLILNALHGSFAYTGLLALLHEPIKLGAAFVKN